MGVKKAEPKGEKKQSKVTKLKQGKVMALERTNVEESTDLGFDQTQRLRPLQALSQKDEDIVFPRSKWR